MRDGLTDEVHRLRRQRQALRRRIVFEALLGVIVLGLGVAAVVWLVRGRSPQPAAPPPATETAVTTPPVTEPPVPPRPEPEPVGTPASPAQVPQTPLAVSIDTADPTRPHPAGVFAITVERAFVTSHVLTRFFGIPATNPDPALVLEVRIANPSPAATVHYRTLRGSSDDPTPAAMVTDDAGRLYPAIEYGAVPRGGVIAATLEPGSSVGDVLTFRAVPPDIAHLDLTLRGSHIGSARDVTIRLPASRLEFEPAGGPAEAPPTTASAPPPPRPAPPTSPPGPDPVEVRAHQALLERADAGDAAAQLAVARRFETGQGAEPDPYRAMTYYTMAAEQGEPEAQWALGRCYRDGIGLAPEPDTALKWFLKAAMQEHRAAQWAATRMLRDGDGVRENLHQAKRWLAALVEAGDREAHLELVGLDPERYMEVADRLRLRNVGPANTPGVAVRAEGRLRDGDGSEWTLVLDNGRTTRLDLARLLHPRLKAGIQLEAFGILGEDGTIETLHATIPEARCAVTVVRVLSPQGIVPYRRTLYVAEITVGNSGVQPIQAAHVTARVRVMATMSESQTATVPNLSPGESRLIRLEFSVYNPGTVSPPVCDVLDLTVDW